MEHIKIITDSAADIKKSDALKYNISVLPLRILFKDKYYSDGVDFESREFTKMLRNCDEIPKTSMVPPADIKDEFLKNLDNYEHQIYVTISSNASGNYNAAQMMKEEIESETGKPSNITVIDSMSLTFLYGMGVIKMAQAAIEGKKYDEVIEIFRDHMKRITAYFIVDDLKYLQKGGRINPGVAVVGNLLGIKPILTVRNGLVDAIGKERGKKRALDKIFNLMMNDIGDCNGKTIYIPNADADEDVEIIREMLKERLGIEGVDTFEIGSTIVSHSGAGLVGLVYIK